MAFIISNRFMALVFAMRIGFVLPHEKSTEKISHYAVSIDSIETLTGIDFFPKLPNKIEKKSGIRMQSRKMEFIVNLVTIPYFC